MGYNFTFCVVCLFILTVVSVPPTGVNFGFLFFSPKIGVILQSLNCNGLSSMTKLETIKRFADDLRYEILFLQETHVSDLKNKLIFETLFNVKSYWSPGGRKSRGVVIFVKNTAPIKVDNFSNDFEGRILKVNITYADTAFCLVNVYLPNITSLRSEKIRELHDWLVTDRILVLGGDFNFVEDRDLDKLGGDALNGSHGIKAWRELASKFNLIDTFRTLFASRRKFSYHKNNVHTRIDRFYILSKHSSLLSDADIVPSMVSDHDFVGLHLNLALAPPSPGRGYWKLDLSVLSDETVFAQVQEFILDFDFGTPGNLLMRWDVFKSEVAKLLSDISKRLWHLAHDEINSAKRVVKGLYNQMYHNISARRAVSPALQSRFDEAKGRLNDLIAKDVESVRQRLRIDELENMDASSRFLFDHVAERRNKSLISSLNVNGIQVRTNPGLLTAAVDYYGTLLNKDDNLVIDDSLFERLNFLSDVDSLSLTGEVDYDETRSCLRDYNRRRSPGLDGLAGEFYEKFEDLLSVPLTNVFNESLQIGTVCESMRAGVISLLCKDEDNRDDLDFYRPITLLNFDVKVFARILDLRMRKVARKIIGPHQFFNWKDHPIDNAVHYLSDMIRFVKERKIGCYLVGLDQKKAFDRVDHDFLFYTLERFGFAQETIGWVRTLYCGITSQVLVNGHVSESFPVTRSVRQGCPLSPMLYSFAIEVFNNLIIGDPEILSVDSPNCRNFSKLISFADDNNHIVKDVNSIYRIKHHFDRYATSSGSALNVDKSTGIAFNCVVDNAALGTGLKWVTKAKVLGVYMGSADTTDENITRNIDKLKAGCNRMIPLLLTPRAKALIANTVLLGKLMYVLRFIPVEDSTLREIDSILCNFIWSNKPLHKVQDRFLALDPEEGGLGLHSVFWRVRSFRTSVVCRAMSSPGSSWAGTCLYYCELAFGNFFPENSCRSSRAHRDPYSFSQDATHTRSEGYSLRTDPNPCSSFYVKVVEYTKFYISNRTVNQPNVRSVKEIYATLIRSRKDHRGEPDFLPGEVSFWDHPLGALPLRRDLVRVLDADLRYLNWISALDRLPLRGRISGFGYSLSKKCPLCRQSVETKDHLFWSCDRLSIVRTFVCAFINSLLPAGSERVSFYDLFRSHVILRLHRRHRRLVFLIIAYYKHAIWVHRNDCVFRHVTPFNGAITRIFLNRCSRRTKMDFVRLPYDEYVSFWSTFVAFARSFVGFDFSHPTVSA